MFTASVFKEVVIRKCPRAFNMEKWINGKVIRGNNRQELKFSNFLVAY
jgi:hypothetical protein